MSGKTAVVFGPSPADWKDVSFEAETIKIMDQLTGGPKQLQVISILGMGGLGKTTLANKVYTHPCIVHHFDIRAWICVSNDYMKRDLLLEILSSPRISQTGDISRMSDDTLSDELRKRLMGKRYLIVMDDIWSTGAWDDLKKSFPNGSCGSRILITSRNRDVALLVKANSNSIPHDLRFLSNEESWDLLQDRVFQKETCTPELIEVGKCIAEKCQGLPLSIVVVGGLLARTEKTKDWWDEVENSIRAHLVSDPNHCLDTLELSYNHLPDHLKRCFLYFGSFPEDYEIPVSKLTWLWVAERFIVKSGEEILEDTAICYLIDLIERSLIMISKRGSDGGAKTCRIHDLLHNLCLKKVEEDNFIRYVARGKFRCFNESSLSYYSFPPPPPPPPPSRLCIHSCCFSSGCWLRLWRRCHHESTILQCGLCLKYVFSRNLPYKHYSNVNTLLNFDNFFFRYIPFIPQTFRLLKVLDFGHSSIISFPNEMGRLVDLRYLAFRGYFNEFPKSIFILQNLETLIVRFLRPTSVDADIYRLVKLRHLHINPSASFEFNGSLPLLDLQTLSTPSFGEGNWNNLRSTLNLRKLRCIILDYNRFHTRLQGLEYLQQLEKLKMYYNGMARGINLFHLPASLKKITLSKFRFDWSEISKIARLPNLKILKLLNRAFEGKTWDTSSMGSDFDPFPKLKVLKLDTLNIEKWSASSDHFPNLQVLVVNRCRELEEIPSEVGDIPTLEMVELNWSSRSATDSAKEIVEGQQDMGNEQLKIRVYPLHF